MSAEADETIVNKMVERKRFYEEEHKKAIAYVEFGMLYDTVYFLREDEPDRC
jgi:hypothetical protein